MAPVTTRSTTEVAVDVGLLYVAPIGTTEPTASSDLSSLPSAWREVGYTEDGSTFTYNVNSEMIEVAEELDSIATYITGREGKLAFSMAQATRRNLALALNAGAAAANDATTLEPPDPTAMVRVMLLHVSNDAGAVRGTLVRRCFNTGGLEMAFGKAPQKVLLPVEFSLEKPTGKTPFIVFPNASGIVA